MVWISGINGRLRWTGIWGCKISGRESNRKTGENMDQCKQNHIRGNRRKEFAKDQKKKEGFYREKKRKAEKNSKHPGVLFFKITVLFISLLNFYFDLMKHQFNINRQLSQTCFLKTRQRIDSDNYKSLVSILQINFDIVIFLVLPFISCLGMEKHEIIKRRDLRHLIIYQTQML